MARRRIGGLSLVCAAFLGTTALVLVGPVKAQSVGVTSATDGDPLGRPPSANERILRIGNRQSADLIPRVVDVSRRAPVYPS